MREAHQPPTTSPAGPPHDHPPPSFPRRRESTPANRTVFDKTEPTYYHRPMTTPTKPQTKEPSCNPQSPIINAPPALGKIRQNPTKSGRNSCARVP